MKVLPPSLPAVTPVELAERLRAERRGTPFLMYLRKRSELVQRAFERGVVTGAE